MSNFSSDHLTEEDRERFRRKDRLFAERRKAGAWPADECKSCISSGGCCVRYGHHMGDCCVHCGNDERNMVPHT